MRVRLTKLDEVQLLTCLEHELWGSKRRRFKNWLLGDRLFFLVDAGIAGFAEVTGHPFISEEAIWDNGVFPHRVHIRFVHVMEPENRPSVLGVLGSGYGWAIFTQHLLPEQAARALLDATLAKPNEIIEIRADLSARLARAKAVREAVAETKRKGATPR